MMLSRKDVGKRGDFLLPPLREKAGMGIFRLVSRFLPGR